MKYFLLMICFISFYGCKNPKAENAVPSKTVVVDTVADKQVQLLILGTLQDAGSPHLACKKNCCIDLFEHPDVTRQVVALGLTDAVADKTFLFEATPDVTRQIKKLKEFSSSSTEIPDGIFLSHAHIGHYTGLMYLGKEATNASQVKVFAMPRMKEYLINNGPWSQLVSNMNISLQSLEHEVPVKLTPKIKITPFAVPHRDEYSETVGFLIEGPNKKALFIPDIDKWSKWDKDIVKEIAKVDLAFLDATFYSGEELNARDITQIPHPFILESMSLFQELPLRDREKVHFIHFNHTNPVLNPDSAPYKEIIHNGFHIAHYGEIFNL